MKNIKKLSYVIVMAVIFLGGSVAVFFQQINTVPPSTPLPVAQPVAEFSPPQSVIEPPQLESNMTKDQINEANALLIKDVESNEFYKGLTKKYKSAKNKADAKSIFKKSVLISSTPLHPDATKEDMLAYRQQLITLMDCAKKTFKEGGILLVTAAHSAVVNTPKKRELVSSKNELLRGIQPEPVSTTKEQCARLIQK